MKEGEPILGGPQANPGTTQPVNPGTQPVVPSVPANPTVPVNPVTPATPVTPKRAPLPQSPASQIINRPHFNSQPNLPNSGDIILGSNSNAKKSPKLKIIIPVIFSIIIVVLIVVFVFLSPFKAQASLTDYKNQYLNLIVSGEDSKEDFSWQISTRDLIDSDQENLYYIPRTNFSDGEDTIYYHKLLDLLKNMQSKVNDNKKLNEEQKTQLEFYLSDSASILPYYFVGTSLAYTDSAYNYFLENQNLDGFLSNYDFPFADTEDELLLSFRITIDLFYKNRQDYYGKISKTDCINTDGVDYKCVGELDMAELTELLHQERSLTSDLILETDSMFGLLVHDANQINDIISGENYE